MTHQDILYLLSVASTDDLDLLSSIWLVEAEEFPELVLLIEEKHRRLEWE